MSRIFNIDTQKSNLNRRKNQSCYKRSGQTL